MNEIQQFMIYRIVALLLPLYYTVSFFKTDHRVLHANFAIPVYFNFCENYKA
jgi:hypothetical protein